MMFLIVCDGVFYHFDQNGCINVFQFFNMNTAAAEFVFQILTGILLCQI
jgi:hypothetical protein